MDSVANALQPDLPDLSALRQEVQAGVPPSVTQGERVEWEE